MKYISLDDLSQTIRKNIWKIPRDIDFIIGVPRSGMIVASIISSYLNVPLIDVNSFISGLEPWGGDRLKYFNNSHQKTNKVLVIDDTVYGGTSMNKIKNQLKDFGNVQFIYMCVYLEGHASDAIDIYLEDVRKYISSECPIVLYEWNIFQHHTSQMRQMLFDIDGIFCMEPPDERNEEDYLKYIANATPMFIPRTKLGGIVTYRLSKNRDITEKWLAEQGIQYNELLMFKANSCKERNDSGVSPEMFKATVYVDHPNAKLFVESSDYQAQRIAQMSGKPVFCVEMNKLYQ